ncbi:DEAD/DEAH box helicase [Chlamydia sp. 17-3921]|uniref:DEAD/DEAH box helicase n=1 Tax=Chlamydia sp. 17-3921 TaxID=2675798 RepID=UPI00191AE3AD|nr:DEAD/DEAH box helicase [Chlamydia sp. 17-3921]
MVLEALATFRRVALQSLTANRDDIHIDFFEDCYSIQIPDENSPEGFWTNTLKFDSEDRLIFASCSCPEGECCEHLMTAYLAAYDSQAFAFLHYKFRHSFWYEFFLKLFLDSADLKAQEGMVYTINSPHIACEISCLSYEAFQKWLPIIHITSESKTHIKKTFSQSILYRVAKYFFFFNESGAFLQVEEDSQGLPCLFSLQWQDITFKGKLLDFPTLEDLFPKIEIPHTTLQESHEDFSISTIEVDPKLSKVSFIINPEKPKEAILEQTIVNIGASSYLTGRQTVISLPKKVSLPIYTLPLLPEKIQRQLLPQLYYNTEEKPLRYTIYFLRDASLCFSAYLETPGDLDNGCLIYPNYCYDLGLGLQPISGALHPQTTFIVKSDQIEEFLDETGHLIQETGFKTFTEKNPERNLTYNVTDQGVLLFHYDIRESGTTEIHFGRWTYYSNQGFFLQEKDDSPIQDGLIIEAIDIPTFITKNEHALRKLPGFFASHVASLDLYLEVHKETNKNSGLSLIPKIKGVEETCRLFGNFIYQERVGFIQLPISLQTVYSLPAHIPAEQVPDFIQKFFHNDRILFPDLETHLPTSFELIILSIKRPHPASPLHLEFSLKTNIGCVPLETILQGLKSKKIYLFTKAGFLYLQHYLFQFLQQFLTTQKCLITASTIMASVTDIFKLDALAPIILAENVNACEEDLQFFSQLKAACLPPIPQSFFSIDHKLRPYQNNGLLWLWFLYNYRLSGLLCDEMGLGKTHQATALLDIVYQSTKEPPYPKFLVVCPTSVLPHWEYTLSTHLLGVSIFTFHGPNKPKELPSNSDIILTSYGTLRQNYAKFYKQSFAIAVFDEIHMAKNKTSQIHKILCRLNAHMKLGLTGTPIENNLFEFKGLLDIILPNYLPSDTLFKKLFTKKVVHKELEEVIPYQDLLLKLTRPFILRRTKKLVLPELPDKVESIVPCVLSPEQEKLYSTALQKEKNQIQQLETTEEPSSNFLHIFALLNHLKQICDHPAVFFKKPQNYHQHQSGKWDVFVKLLHESLASGYKVVVFSQYIHMIQIITQYLTEKGIKYASIQGKSLNRKEEIELFSNDPTCQVFVGSLLAAGTGINLTAGNVVIMYDRWWNPAKENQALDRVHRIGQKKTVFIYKLITENTLEERIHYLIEKKIRLLDKIIATQDSNLLHMLNREDLIVILSYKDEHNETESNEDQKLLS